MIKPLLFAVAAFALATPAVASPLGGALSASQNATNNQNNTGSVIQAPSGGSQTNINQNNAYSSTYGFGGGISCPTGSFVTSAFGAGSGSSSGSFDSTGNSYGASVSYIHPIGGSIGRACRELAEEVARQRVLDTQVNLIKVCATFARDGIIIDTKRFPELADCEGVTIASP